MAISRFVVLGAVTVPAGVATAGSFGTSSYSGAAANPTYWNDGMNPGTDPDSSESNVTFVAGQVIYASSLSSDGAPYTLYEALGGAGNTRAFRDGIDNVGHAALSN